jgi:integrase
MKKQAPAVPYTVPVICTTNPKEWYVFFKFFHAGKWHERKLREGINREKDKKKRKIIAEGLAEARLQWLKWGWNPILDPEYKLRKVAQRTTIEEMGFCAAMDFALSKKKLATKSKQDYSNMLKHIKAVAGETGFESIPISQFEPFHVLELMDKVTEKRELSNNSYNKYLDTMRSMFSVLRRRQVIKYNPASDLEHFKVAESNKFISLTPEEKEAITKQIYTKHPRFFTYIQVLYHTGIRPKEILALKIGDIDLKKQLITIAPDIEEENSKTTNVRHVAIANQLLPFLKEMELHRYPKTHFVFGSPFGSGGNRGSMTIYTTKRFEKTGDRHGNVAASGAMRPDYFAPSPNHIKRDTATKLWHTLVMDPETGLGINKHLYALKHTGADDKILAGIDLDALRELYGHSSKLMTETYAKKVREVNRKQIIEKAPSFAAIPLRRVS